MSGWIGPDQCDEHCCTPPCTKATVRCRKFNATIYDSGRLHYEVENALETWIDETCTNEYGVVTVSHYQIDMLGLPDITGDFATSENCTYCIRAINDCGTVTCCDACDPPACSLFVTRDTYGAFTITWSYASNSATDLVVSADVGGVNVFNGSPAASGSFVSPLSAFTFEINAARSATLGYTVYDLVLTVTNDCGAVKKCKFTIPCCWIATQIRMTIAGIADVNIDISETANRLAGGNFTQQHIRHRLTTTGLTAINGTFLFDLSPFDEFGSTAGNRAFCPPKQSLVFIGNITIQERVDANGQWSDFGGGPGGPYTFSRNMQMTFAAYFGFLSPTMGWGIVFQFAAVSCVDLLVAPFGTFTGTTSGFSDDGRYPPTHPGVNDGTYAGLGGFGFYVEHVPTGIIAVLPGLQHQPDMTCGHAPVTRDYWATSARYTMPDFTIAVTSPGVPIMNLTGVPIPAHLYFDAVTLEVI